MSKQRKTRASQREILERLVAHLHDERDTTQCGTPLSDAELGRLLDGEVGPEPSRARIHLSGCLCCLNAYSELAAASQALRIVEAPRAATVSEVDLLNQVVSFCAELDYAIRRRGHRAVQRQYSEPPAHFLERFRPPHDDLLDAEKSRNPDDYHETVERYRYTMSVSLETLERTLKERLQEFQSLKELIAREAVLRATLLDFSAQRSLLSQLDSASVVLMDWVEQALEQVTPFFL